MPIMVDKRKEQAHCSWTPPTEEDYHFNISFMFCWKYACRLGSFCSHSGKISLIGWWDLIRGTFYPCVSLTFCHIPTLFCSDSLSLIFWMRTGLYTDVMDVHFHFSGWGTWLKTWYLRFLFHSCREQLFTLTCQNHDNGNIKHWMLSVLPTVLEFKGIVQLKIKISCCCWIQLLGEKNNDFLIELSL